ncbi:MAG: hypothetical protein AAF242_05275 [Bacteroidota bacterium]
MSEARKTQIYHLQGIENLDLKDAYYSAEEGVIVLELEGGKFMVCIPSRYNYLETFNHHSGKVIHRVDISMMDNEKREKVRQAADGAIDHKDYSIRNNHSLRRLAVGDLSNLQAEENE